MTATIEWDAALDAMVACPGASYAAAGNDQLRVVVTHVPPGERTAVHTHAMGRRALRVKLEPVCAP